MKIKVDRARLLKSLENALAKKVTESAAENESYNSRLATAREKLAANAEKFLYDVRDKKKDLPGRYDLADILFKGVKLPSEPSDKETDGLKLKIRKLQLSVDETLVLTDKDDYFQYV